MSIFKIVKRMLLISFILALAVYLTSAYSQSHSDPKFEQMSYNQFTEKMEKGLVKSVTLPADAPTFTTYVLEPKLEKIYDDVAIKSVTQQRLVGYVVDNPKTSNFKEILLKAEISVTEPKEKGPLFGYKWLLASLIIIFSIGYLRKKEREEERRFQEQYQRRSEQRQQPQTQLPEDMAFETAAEIPKITFDDIAGHAGLKKDVQILVDFLKEKEAYTNMGARLPKGTILYGPPGTGKTMVAKAIANEAGVNFIAASGSDFIEKYVGVGAKRVRDLFKEARKSAPAILFIDEIDAMGGKRQDSNNNEKDQTLNALLTELDGFNEMQDILVIAATNRLDMLDEALIRPGRFDKHIAVPLPDRFEREEILAVHVKNKKIAQDVTLRSIAELTPGFSGAALESLLNEAAILAVTKKQAHITAEDVDDAFYKVVMKGDKKAVTNQKQQRLIAWHEAGHALVAKLLTNKSVPKVTIIPSTNGAGGVTFIIPESDQLQSKRDLEADIQTLYAGRIAEYLLTGDANEVTTGASQDIKQSTKIILAMIKNFGMTDEFGMLDVSALQMHDTEIQEQAKTLAKDLYKKTETLMTIHFEQLKAIAELLLEKETIVEAELDAILLTSLTK